MLWFFWTLPVLAQHWCSTCLLFVQCTHSDTEEKPRKARVRNIFWNFRRNTIFNEHPVCTYISVLIKEKCLVREARLPQTKRLFCPIPRIPYVLSVEQWRRRATSRSVWSRGSTSSSPAALHFHHSTFSLHRCRTGDDDRGGGERGGGLPVSHHLSLYKWKIIIIR